MPIREATDGPERREAARQLLEAFYRQILADGFFHADPHPGNLLWSQGRITFLDLGMVGELGPELRELLILLLLAFWRDDPKFLAEAVLMIAGEEQRSDLDLDALEGEFATFIERFRVSSLSDIRIAAMLDGMIEIAGRHGVRLPAALALSGKAFGQMQLAVAELDPTLDPFGVVSAFLLRNLGERLRAQANPQRLYYEGQKLRLRLNRFVEAVERAAGARPGSKLQVEFLGSSAIEQAIRSAGRRLALAAVAAAGLVGAATTAAADTAGWISAMLGCPG
ncbi:MAG TPA: AarF/UbiB family protein [Gaiellaceae bacterium]|nr:AarF/UbiB family protein [Gaiellaceae bacterium]